MKNVHPITALVTLTAIVLTAEAFVNREKSLLAVFFDSLGA